MSRGLAILIGALMLSMIFSGCIGPEKETPTLGDVVPPAIYLNSPYNNSFVKPGENIDISVNDSGGLKSVEVSVDDGDYRESGSPVVVNTSEWKEGEHTVRVRAEDISGNKADALYIFLVDLTPPAISMVFPSNGSAIESDSQIILSIKDEHLMGANYTVDGGLPHILPYPFHISVEWWSEGEHNITVNALDLAGNPSSARYRIIIDNEPTGIKILSPKSRIIRPGVPIVFEIDEKNLAGLKCTVNGVPVDFSERRIDTSGWSDGSYYIVVNASDLAGHRISRSYLFEIDSTPPDIRASEENGSTVSMNATLNLTDDSFSHDYGNVSFHPEDPHLLSVGISVNGGTYRLLNSPYLLSLYGMRGRTVNISVRAIDAAGNTGYLNLSLGITYKLSIELPEGNAPVSIPLLQNDSYVRDVFESINGSYDKVSTFSNGSWKTFNPEYPDKFSDIKYIEPELGYILSVNRSSAVLNINGTLPGSYTLELRKGSNLVPYLSMKPMRVRDAFGGLPWYSVERWDAQTGKYVEMGDYDVLKPGETYWVYLNHPSVLVYDF